jgi:prefoldin alpha subunit
MPNPNPSPELIQKAQLLHQQSQELEQQVDFIDKQVMELTLFSDTLDILTNSNEDSSFSSLGKGVYMKTKIEERELYVEVGSGIIIKKTPQETKKAIIDQIDRFKQIQTQLKGQLEIYQATLIDTIEEIEKGE